MSADCSKHRFPTELDAKLAMLKMRRRQDDSTRPMPKRAYWCSRCKAYHVTSSDKRNPSTQPARGGPGVEGLAVE